MSKDRVIFLDYDGVVNVPKWENRNGKWHCRYSNVLDGKVNDEQAVQWVFEFCQKYGFSIIVSSTWRGMPEYRDCLIKAGLREGVEILGRTPYIRADSKRGQEIEKHLLDHPEIKEFLIFDDEEYGLGTLRDHLVQCDSVVGFTMNEYAKAENLYKSLYGKGD